MPDLEERRYLLMYQAKLSAMYHQRRERWFETLDRYVKAFAAIAGLAAVVDLIGGITHKELSAAVAASAVLSMVFDFSGRVRLHADYANRFKDIQADLLGCGSTLDEARCCAIEAALVRAEKGEPKPLSGLVLLCQNEIAVAEDQPERVQQLPFWRRPFVHIWDMDMHTSLPTVQTLTQPDRHKSA